MDEYEREQEKAQNEFKQRFEKYRGEYPDIEQARLEIEREYEALIQLYQHMFKEAFDDIQKIREKIKTQQ
jgi:chromosome segregation ATPase